MPTRLIPTESEREKFRTAARDTVLLNYWSGRTPSKIFDARVGDYVVWKPQQGNYCGNLLDLARKCCAAAGAPYSQVINLSPFQLSHLAMGTDPERLGLGSMFASSDGAAYNVSGMFGNVLFDAANVTLRQSFDEGRASFDQWMKKGEDIPDFRETHRGIAGEFGDPRAVPENGEFEETTVLDGKEKTRLTVWGQMFSTSWQLLMNGGRLGLFLDAPSKMGNAMKRKMNRLAYQSIKDSLNLSDNIALFDANAVPAGHNNITTGALATAADYISAWSTMSKKMREQKGLSTDSAALNIPPFHVLFPPSLSGIIRSALNSTSVAVSGNAGEVNIWKGMLNPVEDAELGASSLGGSDVKHYVAANTADIDTVEYSYLAGLAAPAIEQETAFDRLAIRRRIYFAFAVKPLDFRGLQRHNGA